MKRDKPLVCVSGCFRIFHCAHIFLLKEASKLGNVIVLLNSDEGVRVLKGEIIESFEYRKALLLATGLVTEVIKFDTDPTEELRRLRPDYQVLGSDHTKDEVLSKGGEFVGEIVIIPRVPNVSATEIYKKRLNDAKDRVATSKVQYSSPSMDGPRVSLDNPRKPNR